MTEKLTYEDRRILHGNDRQEAISLVYKLQDTLTKLREDYGNLRNGCGANLVELANDKVAFDTLKMYIEKLSNSLQAELLKQA